MCKDKRMRTHFAITCVSQNSVWGVVMDELLQQDATNKYLEVRNFIDTYLIFVHNNSVKLCTHIIIHFRVNLKRLN